MSFSSMAYPNLIYRQSSAPADITAGRLWVDTDDGKLYASNGAAYNDVGAGLPVGSILPWNKSYTNTPALASNFVECNGQVLSDAESVYNGQTIPDLNGGNVFLRGNSTSTATGGAATHNHGTPFYFTSSSIYADPSSPDFGTTADSISYDQRFDASSVSGSNSAAATSTSSNLPPYYNIVWVMKIK